MVPVAPIISGIISVGIVIATVIVITVPHLTQLYDSGMLIMGLVFTHSPNTQNQCTAWHSLLMVNSWHLVASTNVFTFGPLR
jgi:hypothetical protein